MIDRLDIRLPNFTGDLTKCKPSGWNKQGSQYRLYNFQGSKWGTYLQLVLQPDKTLIIKERSLRKWKLGNYSLADLNSRTFIQTIKKIADALGISPEELSRGTITNCEIGLNINTRIPCEEIISSIKSYSVLKWYQYAYETVGFLGENQKLKIYNKIVELKNHGRRKREGNIPEQYLRVYDKLEEKGTYVLRIEFTLKDRRSFEANGLKHIRTVGDIASNYKDLYSYWTREVNRIVVAPVLRFDKDMTANEYMIARILSIDGVHEFERECLERSSNSSSKAKLRKEMKEVLKKYGQPGEFNREELNKVIVRKLWRIHKFEEKLNLPELIANVWGITPKG